MKYLFHHKYKLPSGVVFYVSSALGLLTLFVDYQWDDLWTIPVYSILGDTSLFSNSPSPEDGFPGKWVENGIFNEVLTMVIIISGLINSFSKEKIEDEMIGHMRSNSLVASLFINYGLLLVANLILFDISFYFVLIIHLFSLLLVFNLLFRYRLWKYYKVA